MSNAGPSKGVLGAGMLSAVASSLCCIAPVLAIVGGTSGLAGTFSWAEPARPYFVGASILILGYAWYRKLKVPSVDECGCTLDEKPKFIETKKFLAIVTILSVVLISFPLYAKLFFQNNIVQASVADNKNIQQAEFIIEGMTCSSCEEAVKHEVNKLPGIARVFVSYEQQIGRVDFDKSATDVLAIAKAINSTGYLVIKTQIKSTP